MSLINRVYVYFSKREFLTLGLILLIEAVMCFIIVDRIAYTEIDWVAYMQEVEGFLGGEYNYSNLRGNTGPLVYPAGFVYIFSILRWLTDNGANIVKGQYIFAVFYLIVVGVTVRLHQIGKRTPLWALVPLLLSKRMHSIFVLRLFNDCVAVMLGYIAIYLFAHRKWRFGCFFYSLSGVLLVLLLGAGLQETILCLSICAALQLILGLPFLLTFPLEYIKNSFDLGRVFMFQWTVNFKFLAEDVFVSKTLSILLLALTLAALVLFARKWLSECQVALKESGATMSSWSLLMGGPRKLHPHFIILTIFASNFIGIVFARTLHYQFYAWYFHMLPYLLWHTKIPTLGKVTILAAIEFAFNVFPATALSSAVLQVSHFVLLAALWTTPLPSPVIEETEAQEDGSPSQMKKRE